MGDTKVQGQSLMCLGIESNKSTKQTQINFSVLVKYDCSLTAQK